MSSAAEAIPAEVRTEVIDYGRLIACIIEVEGNATTATGGNLGFTLATWRQFEPHLPYYLSQNKPVAAGVARKALASYSARRAKEGHVVTVEFLAQCWLSGYTGARRLFANGANPEYGRRVANLYRDAEFRLRP